MEALKILAFWTVGLPVYLAGIVAGAAFVPMRAGWREGVRLVESELPEDERTEKRD